MIMNVISNIMVGTGMALILIGVIGLVLSWVCEKGEETAAADAVPASHGPAGPVSLETAHSAVSRALDAPSGEGLEMNEEEARNGDAV